MKQKRKRKFIGMRAVIAVCVVSVLFLGCSDDPSDPGRSNETKEEPENTPPVIQEQPDTSANIGNVLTLRAIASDPDGDVVAYALKIYLNGRFDPWPDAEIDPHSGLFQFAPKTSDIPSRRFAFVARDDHGAEAETEFVVAVTNIEQGGRVKLYIDDEMSSCSLVDTEAQIIRIHMFHTDVAQVKAVQFAAPAPSCWIGATWLGDTIVTGVQIGNTQDTHNGMTVGYQDCVESPVYIGYMNFSTSGMAPACCAYSVMPPTSIPSGKIKVVDCLDQQLFATGGKLIINPDETCPCEFSVSVRQNTWGQIKSLYDD